MEADYDYFTGDFTSNMRRRLCVATQGPGRLGYIRININEKNLPNKKASVAKAILFLWRLIKYKKEII